MLNVVRIIIIIVRLSIPGECINLMKYNTPIKINAAMKHMSGITKKIRPIPIILENTPQSPVELIEETVRACIASYRQRAENSGNPTPLNDEKYAVMTEIGKFAFGVHYNTNDIDEAKAIETAILAVNDGLVRIFKGNEEITGLEGKLEICEDDIFTFVRMTFLTGI